MLNKIKNSYTHTIFACGLGYVVQAIVNNFVPLLFVFLSGDFGISLSKITLLITINFSIQLTIDLLSAGFIDRIGYRASIIIANIFASAGLVLLGILPYIMNPFTGLLTAVCVYAIGGGLLEVVVSPIVEACPTTHKAATMSLLHSFYCWGHVIVVILSTLFFRLAGMENWRIASFLWALWPLTNIIYFTLVPIPQLEKDEKNGGLKNLLSSGLFWLLVLLMLCAGAAELAMSQWASAFAEKSLNITKTTGDLLGTLMFATLMGISRVAGVKIIAKLGLRRFLLSSCGLCIISYLIASCSQNPILGLLGCGLCGFSVGIMWPGTYSTAAKLLPSGGTAMFALLALGGDLGASGGPTLVGLVSGALGDNLKAGLLAAVVFPVVLLIGIAMIKKDKMES